MEPLTAALWDVLQAATRVETTAGSLGVRLACSLGDWMASRTGKMTVAAMVGGKGVRSVETKAVQSVVWMVVLMAALLVVSKAHQMVV
jgi:hypothetical protein